MFESGIEKQPELTWGAIEYLDTFVDDEVDHGGTVAPVIFWENVNRAALQELDQLFNRGVEGKRSVEANTRGEGVIGIDAAFESIDEV